ncbi:MAG: hypothetical protein HYU77_12470 [Betaproteobacteria bacterium]|nr:hypothetical protein [Betaproteobacteria bacterium]
MKEPKILPWLARKSGLSLAAARCIWRDVVLEAGAGRKGSRPGPEYYRHLMNALRKRLAQASPTGKRRAFPVVYPGLPAALIVVGFHVRLFGQFWSAWARAARCGSTLWPRLIHWGNQNI